MSPDGGFVRVYRRVLQDPDFATAAEALAFVYLILKASWRDCSVRYKGRRVDLKRGQLALSVRDMAADLEWSKSRADRFLTHVTKRDKIGTDTGTGVNIVTISKYEEYQAVDKNVGTAPGQERDTSGTQNKEENISIPNGMGVPPVDTVKAIFELGVTLLTASGQDERASRSIVGRWRKNYSDSRVLEALIDCQNRRISNPVEWMPRRLAAAGGQPQASDLASLIEQSARYRKEAA